MVELITNWDRKERGSNAKQVNDLGPFIMPSTYYALSGH